MKSRQSRRSRIKRNANSPRQEEPPDEMGGGINVYPFAEKIRKYEKFIRIFLTKKFRPLCAEKLENEIRIMKAHQEGIMFALKSPINEVRKKKEWLKTEIAMLSKAGSVNKNTAPGLYKIAMQFEKEKTTFLEGIEKV